VIKWNASGEFVPLFERRFGIGTLFSDLEAYFDNYAKTALGFTRTEC
jgi:hypothetical protein